MKRTRMLPSARSARLIAVVLLALVVVVGLTICQAPHRASAAPTGPWASVAAITTPRVSLAAATGHDGLIYAVGGIVPSGPPQGTPVNTVEAYNPSTGLWTTQPSMPTARGDLAAATGLDGRIYAIGGYLPPPANYDVNTVEAYDPSSSTWSTVAPMPTARDGLVAVTGPDGHIYAIGGESNGTFVSTVEAYDPGTNTWTTLAPMPTPTWRMAATAGPDGRIYVFGGDTIVGGSAVYLNTAEAYNPATNTWTSLAPMSTARFVPSAAAGPDGHIYAVGGYNTTNGLLNSVEAFDPSTGTWSAVASLATARYEMAAATDLNGNIYAISGVGSAGLLSSVETLPVSGAPPANTMVTPSTPGSDGVAHVDWHNAFTLSTTGCSGASASYQITRNGAAISSGAMTEGPAGTYTASLAPFLNAASGPAWVTLTLACTGGAAQNTAFAIYIDPSGTVRDAASGQPIPGATVTLYRSDSASGPFSVVPDGSSILSPATSHDPQTTGSDGRYLWNVVSGYYKVRAASTGCVSPTDPSQAYVESAVLTIPPAATGVDLQLRCAQPDADLGFSNVPANIAVNATSSQGAVVTYTSPTATDESGDIPAATVSCVPTSGSTFAIGTTTVTCTANDADDAPGSVSQSFGVTVNPVLTANVQTVSATEGSAFSGTVATGADYGAGTLAATITWGDGSSSAGVVTLNADGAYSIAGSHVYAEEGASVPLAVQVSASGGLSANAAAAEAVADAALSAQTPAYIASHRAVGLALLFTDADPNGAVSDYTATITWGDGASSAATIVRDPYGSDFIAAAGHLYAAHGTYTITITINDGGGASVTKTLVFTA